MLDIYSGGKMMSDVKLKPLATEDDSDAAEEADDQFQDGMFRFEKRKKSCKLRLILSYLVIWAVSVTVFWCFTAPDDGMIYSLMFLWIILPAATFAISLLISRNNCWGKWKWLGAIGFGVMYMLGEYATFSMANNIAFNKVNVPDFSMIITGAAISLIGMGVGHLLYLKNINGREQKNRR